MGNLPSGADELAPDRHADAPLAMMTLGLNDAIEAYEKTVGLLYETERHDPEGPWLGRMQARAERLLAECRLRARLLAELPARTITGAALKGQALRRYCEADVERDPRSFQVIYSLCADLERLAAEQEPPFEMEPRRLGTKPVGGLRRSRRWQES